MHQSEVIIEARGLWKSFDRGRIPVIQGASLQIHRGEMVALWGTSGSGKSTLLHLLSGLDVPDSGMVTICGMDAKIEANRLRLRRQHLGFVFQLHHLIPDLTLDENLRLPALAAHANPKKTLARIEQLTAEVGLSHRRGHRIQDLSGGERQRTAICRALMNHPELIFADEPTGSLDEETGWIIFELLSRLVKQEQVAVVLATHERRFVEHCDRVLRVQQGKLVAA
jgi:ABC-type lipoprotein export system ATPase subunit